MGKQPGFNKQPETGNRQHLPRRGGQRYFLNNTGSILIIAFTVLYVIIILTAGFSLLTFGELNAGQRFRNSEAALWLAEAGLVRYLKDPSLLDYFSRVFPLKHGSIILNKNDTVSKRVLTSAGLVGTTSRAIQVDFPARPPVVFNNSMSSGKDVIINGIRTAVTLGGRLRVGGKIKNTSRFGSALIEDARDRQPAPRVLLMYPDADHNGKPDEFTDFVAFNRNLVASYPKEDVVYVKTDESLILVPDTALRNKRIVYVEGHPGKGDVALTFAGPWEEGQNLTIISTGTITFQPTISMPSNSQLNFISWSGYREASILPNVHNGVIFTHGKAVFDNIYDNSTTNGNVIANGGIELGEIWSRKTFNYRDTRADGSLPPGFEGLAGARSSGYESRPSGWREVSQN